MKTRGVDLVEGYIVVGYGRSVPDAFWSRLKHEMQKARALDAFAADYHAERAAVLSSMPAFPSEQYLHKALAEERLFRRWTERVVGPQALWPWERGWTPELVDSFLSAPVAKEAA